MSVELLMVMVAQGGDRAVSDYIYVATRLSGRVACLEGHRLPHVWRLASLDNACLYLQLCDGYHFNAKTHNYRHMLCDVRFHCYSNFVYMTFGIYDHAP
jgi:hypothetical protein